MNCCPSLDTQALEKMSQRLEEELWGASPKSLEHLFCFLCGSVALQGFP